MSAAFVIQGLALPMVKYFGQGDSAKGYQITMGIFAVLAVLFFFMTFATTKERVQPDPAQKSTIAQDFGDLTRNGPWLAIFVAHDFRVHHAVDARRRDALLLQVLRESRRSVQRLQRLRSRGDDRGSGRFGSSSAAIRQA